MAHLKQSQDCNLERPSEFTIHSGKLSKNERTRGDTEDYLLTDYCSHLCSSNFVKFYYGLIRLVALRQPRDPRCTQHSRPFLVRTLRFIFDIESFGDVMMFGH